MKNNIKPGDVVSLKSGGPAITVASIKNNRAMCYWMLYSFELEIVDIPLIALMKVDVSDYTVSTKTAGEEEEDTGITFTPDWDGFDDDDDYDEEEEDTTPPTVISVNFKKSRKKDDE